MEVIEEGEVFAEKNRTEEKEYKYENERQAQKSLLEE